MKEFRTLWCSAKKYILILVTAILVYEICENLGLVTSYIAKFLSVLKPLFIGLAIAFIANFPMRFLENKVFKKLKSPKLKRAICLSLAFIFLLAVIFAIIVLIIPHIIDSVKQLWLNFDRYVDSLIVWGEQTWIQWNLNETIVEKLRSIVEGFLSQLDTLLATAVTQVVKFTVSVASIAFNLFLALVLSLYMLFKKEKLIMQAKKLVIALFKAESSKKILDICSAANTTLNKYVYGMLIECTILGVMCYIGMKVFKFPFELLISFMVGLTQMVPVIGPWISGAIGFLIILVVNPPQALWFMLFLLVIQQLEEKLFYPKIVGGAVGLSGLWVIIAIVVGGGLFGIIGIVLAVPIAALLQTLLSEWIKKRLKEKSIELAPEE